MKIYVIAGVTLLVLIVGGVVAVICVIRSEAEQTRQAMREMSKPNVPDGIQTAVETTLDQLNRQSSKASDIFDKAQDTLGKTLGSALDLGSKPDRSPPAKDEPVKPDAPAKPGAPANTPADPVDRAADAATKTPDTVGDTLSGDSLPNKAGDVIDKVFDLGGRTARTGDDVGQKWVGLTPAEESKWGRQLHEELLKEKKVIHNAKSEKRLRRLAEPLLRSKKRPLEYTFTILDEDEINAFSMAGGYVYVNQGLIKFAADDQELQSVLGHEIGHVDLGHCSRTLAYILRAEQFMGPAGQVVGILHGTLARSFSQAQEFDADEYGFRAMLAAGATREQAMSFLVHLQSQSAAETDSASQSTEADGTGSLARRVESHFGSHPPTERRIARLKALPL